MPVIRLLEQATIDKIAAGEVVERPRSVVKELTENSIDAGATAVTVEIRDGGIGMIRVTDDGAGIPADQVRKAFLRHATSKIEKVDDLTTIQSFGFRGEALSSIAAVSRVELITKTHESLTGTRYRIEGGMETGMEEIGAPDGSTFIMRDLFYNTPARRKFLKSAQTEAGYISEFCERLALSHPDLAIRFMVNGTAKLSTSGNGRQMDVIYRIFGRDITGSLIEIDQTDPRTGMHLHGYLGKPQISRGNRTYEIFYVNGRLISSSILSKASEEGYETFLMQHRFPFLILSLDLDGTLVDVNVHPAKAQVRFADGPGVYEFVRSTVKAALTHRELIIKSSFGKEESGASGNENSGSRGSGSGASGDPNAAARERARQALKDETPEPFEKNRRQQLSKSGLPGSDHVNFGSSYAGSGQTVPGSSISGSGHAYDFNRLRQDNPAAKDSPYSIKYPHADQQRASSWKRLDTDKNFLEGVSEFLDKNHNFSAEEEKAPYGTVDNDLHSAETCSASAVLDGSASAVQDGSASAVQGGLPDHPGGLFRHPLSDETNIPADSRNSLSDGTYISPEGGYPLRDESDVPSGMQMNLEDFASGSGQEPGKDTAGDDNSIFLTKEHVKEHRLIGQVFGTYWIVQFRNSLYIIDQHAAHEKVMFERLMKRYREKQVTSQRLSPPLIVTLSMAEEDQLRARKDLFTQIGFEIEPFGDRDYAISAVPQDLFGLTEKEFFLEMLDSMSSDTGRTSMEDITARVATMACKAAVKGNTKLSYQEADALIDELLQLDDPYNCPHGRPTIISMTRQDLEKKFRRIV